MALWRARASGDVVPETMNQTVAAAHRVRTSRAAPPAISARRPTATVRCSGPAQLSAERSQASLPGPIPVILPWLTDGGRRGESGMPLSLWEQTTIGLSGSEEASCRPPRAALLPSFGGLSRLLRERRENSTIRGSDRRLAG